jgi:hypothetical protein
MLEIRGRTAPGDDLCPTVDRDRPHSWLVEDIGGHFVVKAKNGQPLVFISYRDGVARRSIRRLSTRGAAQRIAASITKLPDLFQWLSKAAH